MIMYSVPTLIYPIYVRKRVCGLVIEMMKGNQVKDSVEERREKVESKRDC